MRIAPITVEELDLIKELLHKDLYKGILRYSEKLIFAETEEEERENLLKLYAFFRALHVASDDVVNRIREALGYESLAELDDVLQEYHRKWKEWGD